jgi:hypothetical protein
VERILGTRLCADVSLAPPGHEESLERAPKKQRNLTFSRGAVVKTEVETAEREAQVPVGNDSREIEIACLEPRSTPQL